MGTQEQQDFWTTERTSSLNEKLDPKLTAQRQAFGAGQGGRKLTYLEGHAAIAQLNRLFGYGGWSYSVDQMGVDEYTQGPQEQWSAGFWALVTLRVGGVSRQDVGCAEVQNTGKAGSVRDNVHNVDSRSTARKGAVTDALKRAARTFGQQLGNGLYDTDDDVYAWMRAHSLDDGEAAPAAPAAARVAPATVSAPVKTPPAPNAKRQEPNADGEEWARSAADWTRAQLRQRIQEGAGFELKSGKEWKALAHSHGQPDVASSAEMTQAWLLGLYQAMRAASYADAIADVVSADDVADLLSEAKDELDRDQITAQQYRALEWTVAVAGAPDEGAVTRMVYEALGERDRRQITSAAYSALCQGAEARKAELSAPLLAGPRAQVAS